MPYAIAVFAILLLVSGIRGTEKDLGELLEGDFIGQQTFLPWLAAIIGIGSIGYYPPLKKPVDLMLTLLLLVLVLDKNQGVFSKLSQAFTSATSQTSVGVQASPNLAPSSSSSGSSSSTSASSIAGDVATAAKLLTAFA